MARANRLRVDGGVFHVTHRCHNREFLLKEEVRKNLEVSLAERMARDQMKREACWTESLAVGSAGFVEKFKPADFSRRETQIVEAGEGAWALQETATPYRQKTGPKIAAKTSWSSDSSTIHL
jgi:hypothetical protein